MVKKDNEDLICYLPNIWSQTAGVECHFRLMRHDSDGRWCLQMLPLRASRSLSPGNFATKLLYQLGSDH